MMHRSIAIIKVLSDPRDFGMSYLGRCGERHRLFPKSNPMTRYLVLIKLSYDGSGERRRCLLTFQPLDDTDLVALPAFGGDVFWPGLIGDDWEYANGKRRKAQ